jgi:DNA-binding MarR family transcriptional regulator
MEVVNQRVALAEAELAAWGGFLRTHAELVRQLDDELQRAHKLPLSSYDVLVQLANAPGRRLRMAELADAVVLSRSGLTRLVDRLVEQGLVCRSRVDCDARGMYAVLTDAGLARLREASQTHIDGVRRLFVDRLDEEELAALARAWERIRGGGATPVCDEPR